MLFVALSPFTSGRRAVLDTSSPWALPTARQPSSQPMQMRQDRPAGRILGFQLPRRVSRGQLSVASGYLALGLLGMTLLIGPVNLLLRRRNPVSNSLRRDVIAVFAAQAMGIWLWRRRISHSQAGNPKLRY
jgi:hypothetical protein